VGDVSGAADGSEQELRQLLDESCDRSVRVDSEMVVEGARAEGEEEDCRRLLAETCDAMLATDDALPDAEDSEFQRMLEETCGAACSAHACMADAELDPGSPPPLPEGWLDDFVDADSDAGGEPSAPVDEEEFSRLLNETCEGALAAGRDRPSRFKRRREERDRMEEESVPQHVWQRFTPATINKSKCYARTFSGGRGGQCNSVPMPGCSLWVRHSKSASHGLVDGAIP
jgi:hypothetical protein